MRETFDIPIEQIKPNRYQPRSDFNQESLMELAQSIRENGLIQPITVRRSGKGYEIITGERRYRAMRMAGFPSVPCMISEADDIQMAEIALIENLQREDLSAIEEANAYVRLPSPIRSVCFNYRSRSSKPFPTASSPNGMAEPY
jgi:ParB family chromosome partitioning protein